MIDYNLVLYFGIGLIVFGFVLFLVSEHFERQADIKLFRQEQLTKSFNKAKNNELRVKDNQFEINADGTETTKDSIL